MSEERNLDEVVDGAIALGEEAHEGGKGALQREDLQPDPAPDQHEQLLRRNDVPQEV